MRLKILLTAFLIAGLADAQSRTTTVSKGDLLKQRQYRTPGTGAFSYFVDSATGSDGNGCTAVGSPCATIQGTLNKVPNVLQDSVTITLAAGNYAGFFVSGFQSKNGLQTNNGGMMITGALANSVLATGTATGTATAGSAGSGATFGTLTDGTQTWTANDLRGRLLVLTGGTGSGQSKIISSNTGTVVTIVGVFSPAPGVTTTYAIQEPSANITTCTTSIPTPLAAGSANSAAIRLVDNNLLGSSIILRRINVNAACTSGIVATDHSDVQISQVRFNSSVTSSRLIPSGGRMIIDQVYSTGGAGVTHINGNTISAAFTLTNALLQGGGTAITIQGVGYSKALLAANISAIETIDSITNAILIRPNQGSGTTLSGSRLDCSSSSGIAMQVGTGGASDLSVTNIGSMLSNATTNINDCGIAVLAVGNGSVSQVATMTGSVATTLFDSRAGGYQVLTPAGITATSSGTEISLDQGVVTSTIAAVNNASCITTLGFQSKVCKQ